VTCDEVREVLAEHVLGTLEETADAGVRHHLRGCGACRQEEAVLADGLDMVARAHEFEPPDEVRTAVMEALGDEWRTAEPENLVVVDTNVSRLNGRREHREHRAVKWIGVAAVLVLMIGSIGYAVRTNHHATVLEAQASHSEAEAHRYETFLGVLGGENVRVGSLSATTSQKIDGSVVVYDSKEQQNWVLALVQAPGMEGVGKVTLSSADGKKLTLHPFPFSQGGEASTYLVTSSSLKEFDSATLYGPNGETLARASIS
jgi:hypothetical protein